MPKRRLSKDPEEMFKIDANPAPTNDPTVDPKLFIDIKRAKSVPSIPGGQSCPDKIKNGMNLNWLTASESADPQRTKVLSDTPKATLVRDTKITSKRFKKAKPM